MKFLSIKKNGQLQLGVKVEQGIVDIHEALLHVKGEVATTVMEIIHGGEKSLADLQSYLDTLPLNGRPPYIVSEEEIEWGACVPEPNKIICVGLNYRKHADETNASYPEVPILFNKFNNTLTGNQCDIVIPAVTNKLDYEVELAVVIGKNAKNVRKDEALQYIFGYCTANDLSARDLQFTTPQWLLGKTCDDFSPVGPYLVTADEVGNPNQLSLKTYVNGEIRQESHTSDMIFYVDEIVSYISKHMTLTPGDIILTGTPEGVVLGLPEDEQVYLKPNDEVTVEVEKLGALTNRFVAEN
ncbi:fumarylacetoacetate hydrolase family protein [Halalkalibacter hemicellulosilyticus]|uniref:Fumarylacetoacetate hydrolase family protein n=1 Tax=Halalkalibacter hemicellulosilyticusJCM 9152 TaxID=1236971 RepID=W4QCU2_9BACI|nr:fumarylacetoacetate hydrolase family protein [Halalkalibacter hemicellulosilyticus]GAE29871.1 fumarylacetoacetate hydrolase family protein [Halalkalibacter hemicellulosilyticusJCM 9152]